MPKEVVDAPKKASKDKASRSVKGEASEKRPVSKEKAASRASSKGLVKGSASTVKTEERSKSLRARTPAPPAPPSAKPPVQSTKTKKVPAGDDKVIVGPSHRTSGLFQSTIGPAASQSFHTAEPAAAVVVSCENCHQTFENNTVYCPSCDLILCYACDMSVHSANAFAGHERRAVWEAKLYRRPCRYHPGRYVTNFCTSCDEPICGECRVSGPHSGASHVVISMRDAFFSKVQSLINRVNGPLKGRRSALQAVANKLDVIIQTIHARASEIERSTRLDYEGILSRLKRAEGLKLAVCQQDLDAVRSDLLTIDVLMNQISSISAEPPDPTGNVGPNLVINAANPFTVSQGVIGAGAVLPSRQMLGNRILYDASYDRQSMVGKGAGLLQQASSLIGYDAFQLLESIPAIHSQIDGILARIPEETVLSTPTKINLDDLPQEAKERMDASSGMHSRAKEISFKNDLIGQLEKDKEQALDSAKQEIDEWAKLVDRYADELKAVVMKCVFCNHRCLPSIVNAPCPENTADKVAGCNDSYLLLKKAEPILANEKSNASPEDAMKHVGSGRHYFVSAAETIE